MKLHELQPATGSRKVRNRVGRGTSSGFLNINRKEYAIVNLDQLNVFEDGAEVTPVVLIEAGIVKAEKSGVKILGNGELTKKLTVKAAKFSKSAEEAITAKGGSVEVI